MQISSHQSKVIEKETGTHATTIFGVARPRLVAAINLEAAGAEIVVPRIVSPVSKTRVAAGDKAPSNPKWRYYRQKKES